MSILPLIFNDLTIVLKLIKFGFYIFFVILFFRRAKVDDETIGWFAGAFFLCMSLGSILEVVWMLWADYGISSWYTLGYHVSIPFLGILLRFNGESFIYFLGFIGLGFLSVGVERYSILKTKGLISIVPFSLAILVLVTGSFIIELPQYLIALTVAVVPLLYLYIGMKSEGDIRRKAILTFFGYVSIFGGEALNIHILTRAMDFVWSLLNVLLGVPIGTIPTGLFPGSDPVTSIIRHEAWMNFSMWLFEPLLPLIIIIGLILCWYGYKRD
ncbi:MAG: hypothetical protein ACTSSI_06355 [Candidatus Helarchaeota archaeon]